MLRLISFTVLALSWACMGVGTPVHPSWCPSSRCRANLNYPGWSSIKYAFIFGDSYTAIGFNDTGVQPSIGNPLGNPAYPGYTSSNGPNWVDFLTVKYNESNFLTYNLAYGGATVDSGIVAPYVPTVQSVAQQVEDEFFPSYGSSPASAPWKASDTLFGIFIGINDIGGSYGRGAAATKVLNNEIFAVYEGLVDMLYNIGGRNFLFLNVPPVDRSPLTTAQGAAAQALEKADIKAFNDKIGDLADNLKEAHSDVNIFTVDTNSLFTEVLNNPSSFPQTALYNNTTDYCAAYANGTPTEDYFNATCGIAVNQYFWLNALHPTYPVQDVLAQDVAKTLKAGPNVC